MSVSRWRSDKSRHRRVRQVAENKTEQKIMHNSASNKVKCSANHPTSTSSNLALRMPTPYALGTHSEGKVSARRILGDGGAEKEVTV